MRGELCMIAPVATRADQSDRRLRPARGRAEMKAVTRERRSGASGSEIQTSQAAVGECGGAPGEGVAAEGTIRTGAP